MPRRLDSNEKALWGRVIATVEPMHVVKPTIDAKPPPTPQKPVRAPALAGALSIKAQPTRPTLLPSQEHKSPNNLDGHWDRRIDKGALVPDVSVDLHGSGLSGAYARLDGALEQAITQKMKIVLLVTGKPRAHDRASGEGRGAIASVIRDWLASSRHSGSIAAVRGAHPKHGGTGALYIVLKR